jgi:hypothetical protein
MVDTEFRGNLKGRLLFVQRDIEQLQKEEVMLKGLILLYGDTIPTIPKEKIESPPKTERIPKKPVNEKKTDVSSENVIHNTWKDSKSDVKKVEEKPPTNPIKSRHEIIIETALKLLHNREWTSANEIFEALPEGHNCDKGAVAVALSQEIFSGHRIKRISRGMYGKADSEESSS